MSAPAPGAPGQRRRRIDAGRHGTALEGTGRKSSSGRTTKARRSLPPDVEIGGCTLPEDRLYDFENEVWYQPEPAGEVARLGLLAPLVWFAGRFQSVSFRPLEGVVPEGRSVATVESFRYTGAVRLPLNAEVIERNSSLIARPRLLNDAPYGDGWVVRVRATAGLPARLETAAAIRERLAERIRDRHIRCWPIVPDAEIFEIGIECSAVLAMLNDELARSPAGTAVLMVTDDPTSPIEMERWADQTGHSVFAHRQEGTLHHFLVRKEEHPAPRRRPGARTG
jgi:glycine cleavage system H protein